MSYPPRLPEAIESANFFTHYNAFSASFVEFRRNVGMIGPGYAGLI
jgi:hypothetical protein